MADLKEISLDLEEISADLEEIRPYLSVKLVEQIVTIFRCVFWSSRLKIDFSCSNPSIDSLVSGFGGGYPSLTVANVGSDGSQARLDGLGKLVGYYVWLDTPTMIHRCII